MTQRIENEGTESTKKSTRRIKEKDRERNVQMWGKGNINLEYRKSGDGWISRNVKRGRSGRVENKNKPAMQAESSHIGPNTTSAPQPHKAPCFQRAMPAYKNSNAGQI